MKFQTKVQYAEYNNNKHLRRKTETVGHVNSTLYFKERLVIDSFLNFEWEREKKGVCVNTQ